MENVLRFLQSETADEMFYTHLHSLTNCGLIEEEI